MLASAVAAGWSTYLHWLPCRGSMLSGSIIYGYDYVGRRLLRRMFAADGRGPGAVGVRALYVACDGARRAGLANARPRAAAAAEDQGQSRHFPVWPRLPSPEPWRSAKLDTVQTALFLVMLLLTIELSAVVALLAISAWQPDARRSPLPAPGGCAVGYDGLWCHPHDR